MGRVIARSLGNLVASDVKVLKLGPGVSANSIVPGCKVFEPTDDEKMEYRGLVIHRSPQGNQIVTVQRTGTGNSRAIDLQKINLRHYDDVTGRINHGASCQLYFESLGDEGYTVIDTKLRELRE